jgi:tetratricopeptide (TPR) repeat protein
MKNLAIPVCLSLFIAATGSLQAKENTGTQKGATAATAATAAKSVTESDLRAITFQYNTGQYVEALQRSRAVLNRDPGNLDAHYLIGNIFMKLGRLENAAEEYDFCVHRGHGTQVANFAQKALDGLNAAFPPPGGQAPGQSQAGPTGAAPANTVVNVAPAGMIDRQTNEVKASVQEKAQAALAARRSTLAGQMKTLTEEQQGEIDAVPKYIYVGRHRVANPDYNSTVQGIRDDYAAKMQILQADNDNEERKMGIFYKGLSDSYDHSKGNLQSQTDDGRPGHKLLDQDPSMYVQNFGTKPSQSQVNGSGVQLNTKARQIP